MQNMETATLALLPWSCSKRFFLVFTPQEKPCGVANSTLGYTVYQHLAHILPKGYKHTSVQWIERVKKRRSISKVAVKEMSQVKFSLLYPFHTKIHPRIFQTKVRQTQDTPSPPKQKRYGGWGYKNWHEQWKRIATSSCVFVNWSFLVCEKCGQSCSSVWLPSPICGRCQHCYNFPTDANRIISWTELFTNLSKHHKVMIINSVHVDLETS